MSLLSITPNPNNSTAITPATPSTENSDGNTPSKTLRGLIKSFWSYTEKAGEADTSSYNGLL